MKKIKIVAECEAGVCPICGGALTYNGSNRTEGIHYWNCLVCGATGKEGFDYIEGQGEDDDFDVWDDTEFDGNHYDVRLKDGTDVEIISPNDPDAVQAAATTKKERIRSAEAGICPICCGKLLYAGGDAQGNNRSWRCSECLASGKEGGSFGRGGNHYDVHLSDGTSVELVGPMSAVPNAIKPVCMKSGICPLCGGELEYGEVDDQDGGSVISWTCCECGATGEEGREEVFNGEHYDVCDKNGNPVELLPLDDNSELEEGICPFCGAEYRVSSVDDTYEDETFYWVCDHCGATGKALYHSERTFDGFEDVKNLDGMVLGFEGMSCNLPAIQNADMPHNGECSQGIKPAENNAPSNEQAFFSPCDGPCGGSAPVTPGQDEDAEPSISFEEILDLIDAHRCHDGIKTNGDDEILVKGSQAKVDAIADFLDCLGLDVVTGYYDPTEDSAFGSFDGNTGYRYIRVNGQ